MKFLITSSLIIGAVVLLGASTSLNAINTQPLVKSSDSSNIIKVRGGFHGGGMGHMGGGGFRHPGGDFARHGGGNFSHDNFGHHGWNNYGGVGVGVGVGIGGGPGYYGGPIYEGPGYGYDTGTVCVGPDCDIVVE